MNVRAIAEGTVAEAFTTENLQAAYGGRLETDHVARLSVPADRGADACHAS
jgi:manganese/zinc/iron transport system ATP- binding protein